MNDDLVNISWFRKKLSDSAKMDSSDPRPLLAWLKTARTNTTFSAELIPLNDVRGWIRQPDTGNLFHESGGFFSIQGVRSTSRGVREVSSWDQPIYNQTEGGILALLSSSHNGAIKFLLNAKAEPGNVETLQFAPSIQCTWSNIKQAHKGKRPPLAEYVLGECESTLIYQALHNEEGGRFWRKSNSNRIYYVQDASQVAHNSDHFVWASLGQIKSLSMIDNILSPFVKTIIAPL